MINLTVFVIPTGEAFCDRTQESVEALGACCVFLPHADFSVKPATDWKMFLYDTEYLSPALIEAIPIFLENGNTYDFFECYKVEHKKNLLSISPRIYKTEVELSLNSLVPLDPKWRWTIILDGIIKSVKDD